MDAMKTGDAKQEAANSAENHTDGASQIQSVLPLITYSSLWARVIKIARLWNKATSVYQT